MKKTVLFAAVVSTIGLLQTAPLAMAHGHGGHHGGGHHGGGHHGGGHHHHAGGVHHGGGQVHHHGNGNRNVNVDVDVDDHDGDNFWGGAAVGAMVGYGLANSNDPCQDPQYRADYPGDCQGY